MTAAFFGALMGEEAVLRIREKPVWASLVKEAKRYGMQQRPDAYPPDCLNVLVRELESAAKRPPVVLYTGGRSHPALQKVTRLLAAPRSPTARWSRCRRRATAFNIRVIPLSGRCSRRFEGSELTSPEGIQRFDNTKEHQTLGKRR